MDYGPFGVRFLFFNTKKERRSIDELLIYFATPPIPPDVEKAILWYTAKKTEG